MAEIFMQTECVTRLSSYGHLWGDLPVPRIPEEILDCAIYLYDSESSARAGKGLGGSGFLIAVPAPTLPDKHINLAVTNAHVIEEGFTVVRLNRADGLADTVDKVDRDWLVHPDGTDLAITTMPIVNSHFRYKTIPRTSFLTKEEAEKYNVGLGDYVFIIGRFIGYDGTQSNVPTARFGNIAQMQPANLKDKRGRIQRSWIVEGRSIGGYSGSPVFTFIMPGRWNPNDPKSFKTDIFGPALFGVDWCHPTRPDGFYDSKGNRVRTEYYTQENTGFMGVIPVEKLTELLDSDEGIKMMKEAEDAHQAVPKDQSKETDDDLDLSSEVIADVFPKDEGGKSERPIGDDVIAKMLNTPPKPHDADD